MHESRERGRGMTTRRRGFIMVMAISMMFVMVILALGLSTMEQAHHGLAVQVEAESAEEEASEVGFTTLQGIISPQTGGGLNPALMGLPNPLPAVDSGAATASFHAPTAASPTPNVDVALSGEFSSNRSDPESLFRSFTGNTPSATLDGYGDVAGTASGLGVPPRHTRVVETASTSGNPPTSYFAVYSPMSPFGVIGQSIAVADAFSVPDDDTARTGLPVNLFASGSITVAGYLNGRAMTIGPASGVSLGNVPGLGQGGVVLPNQQGLAEAAGGFNEASSLLPSDFVAQLLTARQQVAKTPGVDVVGSIQNFLSQQFIASGDSPPATQLSVLNQSQVNLSGGNLVVTNDFAVPVGQLNVSIPGGLSIGGNLLIPKGGVLQVAGPLQVGKRILMDAQSTLIAPSLTAGELDMTGVVTQGVSPPITTSVVIDGPITLQSGIAHASVSGVTPGAPFSNNSQTPTEPLACGGSQPDPNFGPKAQANTNQANATLGDFFVTISGISATPPNGGDPGVLLVADALGSPNGSGGAGLTLATSPVNKVKGLIVDLSGDIKAPDVEELVGAVWAGGNVSASQSHFLYYPYYTYAYVQTPTGSQLVSAVRVYRTAYGRLFSPLTAGSSSSPSATTTPSASAATRSSTINPGACGPGPGEGSPPGPGSGSPGRGPGGPGAGITGG